MQKKSTTSIILTLLILLALAGVALIFLPTYLQDRQLTDEADKANELNQSFKVALITLSPSEIQNDTIQSEEPDETNTPISETEEDDAKEEPTYSPAPGEKEMVTAAPFVMPEIYDSTGNKIELEEVNNQPADEEPEPSTAAVSLTNVPPSADNVEETATISITSEPTAWNPFEAYSTPEGWVPFSATNTPEPEEDPTRKPNRPPDYDSYYTGGRFTDYNNNSDYINPVDDPDNYNEWLIEYLKTPTPSPVPTPTPVATPTPVPTAQPIQDPNSPGTSNTYQPSRTSSPTAMPTATPTPEPTPMIGLTGVDLSAAKKRNSDFVAWIQIPGTNVDYPIVATNDIDYYLDHDFDGNKTSLGTLFSLGKSDWRKPAKNIAIYGHDVEGSGKKMFKKLLDYKKSSFYPDHAYIYLDSLYRTGVYQIFAVFDITQGDFDPSTSTFASNSEFMNFVNRGISLSYYNTGVTMSPDSTIITLITCDRYFKRRVGRFVVMAVKIK